MTTLYRPVKITTTPKESTVEYCDFCETDVESVTTGSTGVRICADCRSEGEIEVAE